jgi:hypothetical protein
MASIFKRNDRAYLIQSREIGGKQEAKQFQSLDEAEKFKQVATLAPHPSDTGISEGCTYSLLPRLPTHLAGLPADTSRDLCHEEQRCGGRLRTSRPHVRCR